MLRAEPVGSFQKLGLGTRVLWEAGTLVQKQLWM